MRRDGTGWKVVYIKNYEISIVECQTCYVQDELFDLPDIELIKRFKIPILAILNSRCDSKANVFIHGFSDYVTYPFIAAEIFTRLYNCVLRHSPKVIRNVTTGNTLVERTCQYLSLNPGFSKGLDQLAHLMGTNRNTLSKAFRDKFGAGALSWHREQRLAKAADLLARTDLSVQEIAFQIGYSDSNNFSTAFRKKHRVSPVKYRQKMKESKIPMIESKM